MQIPEKLTEQWDYLDEVALVLFRRKYWALRDDKRLFIHKTINGVETLDCSVARQKLGVLLHQVPAGLHN